MFSVGTVAFISFVCLLYAKLQLKNALKQPSFSKEHDKIEQLDYELGIQLATIGAIGFIGIVVYVF